MLWEMSSEKEWNDQESGVVCPMIIQMDGPTWISTVFLSLEFQLRLVLFIRNYHFGEIHNLSWTQEKWNSEFNWPSWGAEIISILQPGEMNLERRREIQATTVASPGHDTLVDTGPCCGQQDEAGGHLKQLMLLISIPTKLMLPQ